MRISFSRRAVGAVALVICAMACVSSWAADKPADLDAELAAELEAWSLKATPRESFYDKYPDLKKGYHEGFREGVALLLKQKSIDDDYRGPDSVKRARASGLFDAGRAFRRAEGDAWLEIAKRLKAAPDKRAGKSVNVLAIAIRVASAEDVALLLDRGADIEGRRAPDKSSPLHLAAQSADHTALLLKRGAKPNVRNTRGETALHLADVACVKLLLEHGADVTIADDLGRTPLHVHAARGGFRGENEAVALLLNHKADAGARDKAGTTPLHLAADAATAALLVKHGAKIAATNKAGDTPLHMAASADLVDFLIKQGGNIKAVNDRGDTPLHTAPTYQAAIALLKHGADLSAVNKKGKRPTDLRRVARVLAYKESHGQLPGDIWGHVMSKMDDPIPANFRANKLNNVLDYVRNTTGVNMYLDWNAIEDHVAIDAPITHAVDDSPAGDVLSAVLEVAAKGKFTWQIDPHGIVLVSTPARMKGLVATEVPPASKPGTQAPTRTKPEEPAPMNFYLNELQGVVKILEEITEIPIKVDWPELEKAGIKRNVPVIVMLNNIALYRGMELIMFDAAGDKAAVKRTKDAIYTSTPDGIGAFMKK